MPIGAVANPFCNDFTNPEDSPAPKTHQVLPKLREIQKAALEIDFNGRFIRTLNRRIQYMGIEEFTRWKLVDVT